MTTQINDIVKIGRPSLYTPELADAICAEIAIGYSLRTICKAESMPCVATIFNWFRTHPGFLEQYEKSKEIQADALAEEMLDIADDGTNDWMEKLNADSVPIGWVLNGEHVQRSRLRLDARKWIASKLKPKKYGDHSTVEHKGSVASNASGLPATVIFLGKFAASRSQADIEGTVPGRSLLSDEIRS